jgi:dTDP-4-amino-4,6-dideoxygalactose transaminase
MRIPAANLKPQLEATRPDWSARLEALHERSWYILGSEGAGFEREFAAFTGARHVCGAGNGTAAIELCLREAGLAGPHATALTSPLTAAFTGIGICGAGARVTFADVDPETLLLDPDDAGNRLTPDVKAIVPVHLYGQPCNMDWFARLARDRGLVLIQDAAQAHGAFFDGRRRH